MLRPLPNRIDVDTTETLEWLDSLTSVINESGRQRAEFLLDQLRAYAERNRVAVPFSANRPYINTIPVDQQPDFPGDRAIERRIKSAIRWNAMAMVVLANKKLDGIGGHISTYQSAATLWKSVSTTFSAPRRRRHRVTRSTSRDTLLRASMPARFSSTASMCSTC